MFLKTAKVLCEEKMDLIEISNSYAEMVIYTEVLKCLMIWPLFFNLLISKI